MGDQEKQLRKEAKLSEKRAALEAAQVVREQAIQEEQSLKEAKRAVKRIAEEPARLAKDQARKKADLAREQAIAKDLEARKLKYNK